MSPPPPPDAKDSAATVLVNMALEEYTLGVTDTEEPYGAQKDRPHIAMMLRAGRQGLRTALARRYFKRYNAAAPAQALADALLVLEGKRPILTPGASTFG